MTTTAVPDMQPVVAEVLAPYPQDAKDRFMALRQIIFEEAARLEVGPLLETLKWGEPSYLTPKSKAGSTIRLGWQIKRPDAFSMFFICSTDLVARISDEFPSEFEYVGNRELRMSLGAPLCEIPARAAVSMALAYHRDRAHLPK